MGDVCLEAEKRLAARTKTKCAEPILPRPSAAEILTKPSRRCRRSKIGFFQRPARGLKVLAFEYFDPGGARRKFLRFSVLDTAGKEDFYISLGSYDDTTEVARELKEIPKAERLYHLDEYTASGHRTYAFFNTKPDYDQARTNVVNILEGKMKPISGSPK